MGDVARQRFVAYDTRVVEAVGAHRIGVHAAGLPEVKTRQGACRPADGCRAELDAYERRSARWARGHGQGHRHAGGHSSAQHHAGDGAGPHAARAADARLILQRSDARIGERYTVVAVRHVPPRGSLCRVGVHVEAAALRQRGSEVLFDGPGIGAAHAPFCQGFCLGDLRDDGVSKSHGGWGCAGAAVHEAWAAGEHLCRGAHVVANYRHRLLLRRKHWAGQKDYRAKAVPGCVDRRAPENGFCRTSSAVKSSVLTWRALRRRR